MKTDLSLIFVTTSFRISRVLCQTIIRMSLFLRNRGKVLYGKFCHFFEHRRYF